MRFSTRARRLFHAFRESETHAAPLPRGASAAALGAPVPYEYGGTGFTGGDPPTRTPNDETERVSQLHIETPYV